MKSRWSHHPSVRLVRAVISREHDSTPTRCSLIGSDISSQWHPPHEYPMTLDSDEGVDQLTHKVVHSATRSIEHEKNRCTRDDTATVRVWQIQHEI